MPIHIIFFIRIYIFSTATFAKQSFKVVVGLSKPPYAIEENNSGFELELIQQILSNMNEIPEFIFIPYGRSEKMLEIPEIDAVITVNKQIFPYNDNLSESYITYQNVAISLKKNAITLNNIADIAHYSIASFQLSDKVLGEEFAKAVASSPMFIQVVNQQKQFELLLLGRVDVLVMDIKIFLYFFDKLDITLEKSDIDFHKIFPLNPYRIAFKSNKKMKAFNQAMREYKASKKYQELKAKYHF
jgi:polar amino acid transport system substrate-binding protein